MVFILLYLVKKKKVIMEELRQHVFSDRKVRLPDSFMNFIEENSVSFERLWNCTKHSTNKHRKRHPYCCCPERLEERNRQKCFQTVATYSRFCVQKIVFTRSRRGFHLFCHISKHAKPLPWVFQAPAAQLLCLIDMALAENNARKKDNIKESSLPYYKATQT
jgi:hypothetical protein